MGDGCKFTTTLEHVARLDQHRRFCNFHPDATAKCEIAGGCGVELSRGQLKQHNCNKEMKIIIFNLERDMNNLKQHCAHLTDQRNIKNLQNDDLQGEIDDKEEEIENLNQEIDNLKDHIRRLKEAMRRREEEQNVLTETNHYYKRECNNIKKQFEHETNMLQTQNSFQKKEMERLKMQNEEKDREIETIRNQLFKNTSEMKRLRDINDELYEEAKMQEK